jgi:sugar lactone lactonase YvrE
VTYPRSLFACALLAAGSASLAASGPSFWTVATIADLLKGTSDGVLIDRTGAVTPGRKLTNRLTSAPAQIWSLAAAADGTLWAGTGGDGRLIRIRPGQPEETAFDTDETNVFAIAVAGNRVYAASGPDGKVYVIDGSAPARVFFDPTEKYIWALAVDAENRVWVGAGSPAVIYRVSPDGTNQVVYRPPAAHVVTLLRDASGRMLAGTEAPGRLYRFDTDAHPSVLLDAGQSELHAIINGPNGAIYAAALNRADDPSSGGGEVSSVVAAIGVPSQPPNVTPPLPSPSSGQRSTIYRIDASGAWESFWESPDLIYDIALQRDGSLLVASGPEGRLYTVQSDRQVSLYTGVDAQQITRLITPASGGAAVMATANPGRVIAIGPEAQSPATYVSPVRDTKSASTWGTIRWEATGDVKIFTRSGNTEKPDETWSAWAGPYADANGASMTSPPARFLQWKAVLASDAKAAAPRLTSVTAAYLPRNSRPSVSSITVYPAGVVFQRPFTSDDTAIAGLDDAVADARRPPPGDAPTPPSIPPPTTGRRMFQKGLQTIAWKAEDTDGDRLSYHLAYRREGESSWHDLKADLNDPIFVWDTTALPDGRYILRVVASDDATNTPERQLDGSRESDPIDIDNTPPTMTTEISGQGATARLVVRVHDAYSPIQKVEYSLGGEAWRLIYPVDGLADSPDERYEIPLTAASDASRIVIRAIDTMQNAASQSAGR